MKYRVQVTIENNRVLFFCDELTVDCDGSIKLTTESEGGCVETAYLDGTVWTEFTVETAK